MLTLYHFGFCPFGRKIALGLREKGLEFEDIIETRASPSPRFFQVSPKGENPVFVDQQVTCTNDYVAVEYLEEVYPVPVLMGKSPKQRAETRRLLAWFDNSFFQDIYLSLFYERILKRLLRLGEPSTETIKSGRSALREALMYIDHLAYSRKFLGGEFFSWADIGASCHLSCIDYLGEIPWESFPFAKEWYVKIKSRPSFRPFLHQSLPIASPASCYGLLDF